MDLLDHFLADARYLDKLFGSHVCEFLDRRNPRSFEFFNRFGSYSCQFRQRRARRGQGGHLGLYLAAFFLFTLDVHVPADQLACEANVLAFLADGQRQLRVFDNHFQTLLFGVDDLNASHFRWAQSLLRKRDGLFAPGNDVDFLAAQLANDGLHAHALHAHAGAHRVDILVAALDTDFGALARLARDGADLHRPVVNLRHFHFEQALHQSGVGARNDHLRPFGCALNRPNRHAQAVAHVIGFQARLFALRQPRFGSSEVYDQVRAFHALHHAVDELAHTRVKFV